MRPLLSHAYHLLLLPIHVLLWPVWRPLAATLLVAVAARAFGWAQARRARVAASGAVLAGWLVLSPPLGWELPPIARLPGLALAVMAWSALTPPSGTGLRVPAAICLAVAAAWWLCGVPLSVAGLAGSVTVSVGLLAASVLGCRILAMGDAGWTVVAGALALAAGLHVAPAAPHWVWAACIPASAALAMVGAEAAAPALAWLTALTALAALYASDRGRVLPVDAACLLPFLAWGLAPRMRRHLGPAPAAIVVAMTCAALVWVERRALWDR